MVDEGRPIDAPCIVGAEYHADTLPHEFTLEKCPVTPCGLHGGRYAGGGIGGNVLVALHPCGCGLHPFLQCGDTRLFAKDGRFEGFANLVAVLVRCRIGQAVILPSAIFPFHLVHRYAVERKYRTVFAQCPETPLTGYRSDHARQLPFEVATVVIDGRQGQPFLPLLFGSRGKVELLFQFPADLHRTLVFVAVGNRPSGFVHTDGNDMDVFTSDVVVAVNDIRLVAEAHALHILLRQFYELFFGHAIFRIGVERDVQDGFLGLAVGGEVISERTGNMLYRVGIVTRRFDNPVAEKHVRMKFVHLDLVVGKHPVQAAAV